MKLHNYYICILMIENVLSGLPTDGRFVKRIVAKLVSNGGKVR